MELRPGQSVNPGRDEAPDVRTACRSGSRGRHVRSFEPFSVLAGAGRVVLPLTAGEKGSLCQPPVTAACGNFFDPATPSRSGYPIALRAHPITNRYTRLLRRRKRHLVTRPALPYS